MSIEKEITKYYNARYEKFKKDLIEVLCKFLGEEYREVIISKINSLDIVYFVTKRDLSIALKNDDLDKNEQKMLEYFLEKLLNYNPLLFGKMSIKELIDYIESKYELLSASSKKLFDKSKEAFLISTSENLLNPWHENILKISLKIILNETHPISLYHYLIGVYGEPTNIESFEYKNCSLRIYENKDKGVISLPIYPRDLSPDGEFLWAILNYVIDSIKKEDIDLWHGSINLGKKLNTHITDYISIILAHNLHENGIFIFDNKYLSKSEKKYERLLESEVYQKIKSYFGNLFIKFLIEPNVVIELVGKENFRQFALWISYAASNLEDEIDYYEEDYEEDEDENKVDVIIPDLDIDIMEVLDDMYLEYLRHQSISLTTIDIKTIMQAKKTVDVKKDYERREIEHDSKYYHLTLLFKYLEKYGNCNIRFYSQDKLCYTLEFKIDKNGKLKITKNIELYDRPLFNYDKTLNNKAKLKETLAEWEYAEEDYDIVLSLVLYYSLYHETSISTNRDLKSVTTDEIAELYKRVLPMFNLNLKELIEWVLSNDTGRLNILTHPRKEVEEDYSPATMELKMETLKKKINEVNDVWRKINNARSKEEYKVAENEWLALNRKARR